MTGRKNDAQPKNTARPAKTRRQKVNRKPGGSKRGPEAAAARIPQGRSAAQKPEAHCLTSSVSIKETKKQAQKQPNKNRTRKTAQKLSKHPAQAPKSQCRTLSGPTGVEFYTPQKTQKTQKKSKKALDKQEQRE